MRKKTVKPARADKKEAVKNEPPAQAGAKPAVDVETLIIGSGFAARSVAAQLPAGSFLLLERGETRSYAEILRRRAALTDPKTPFWEADRAAYRSDLPFNGTYSLSPRCFSHMTFTPGGNSNRWTGRAVRISPAVFARSGGPLTWPLRYEEMQPFYERAETVLNVAMDAKQADGRTDIGRIAGAEAWRAAMKPFDDVRVSPQAKNVRAEAGRQGLCCGAGACELCPSDAKARPDTIFGEMPMRDRHYAEVIEFEGDRATAVSCLTPDGRKRITFKRLVVAANAVESCALLRHSQLPPGVSGMVGHHYQDHALCEIVVRLNGALPYLRLGTMADILIGDLTGDYDGVDVVVSAHTSPPNEAALRRAIVPDIFKRDVKAGLAELQKVTTLGVLLEMPSELDIEVDVSGPHPVLRDDAYLKMMPPRYDKVIARITEKLTAKGIAVIDTLPHYRHMYGVHHQMGGLCMSANAETAVCTPDAALKGTQNVFVAGGALIPMAGGANPTLTVVALSLRLGAHLARQASGS